MQGPIQGLRVSYEQTERDPRVELERLLSGRRETYADLSRLLNRNPAYIQQFIKRGTPRKLDEEDRRTLARYFGVPEETLGGKTTNSNAVKSPPLPTVVTIPRLSLEASAGPGALIEYEQPTGAIAFDAKWLRQLGAQPNRASIIRVKGDSMSPTLNDGDEIMVNHDDDRSHLRDGIYALSIDGALLVKRISMGVRSNRFSILSDNPSYPDWIDFDAQQIEAAGRVIWTGRRVA